MNSFARVGLTIMAAVASEACAPAPRPIDASTLERRYQAFWRKSERGRWGSSFRKELFQLAFPGTHSLSVWHLEGSGSSEGDYVIRAKRQGPSGPHGDGQAAGKVPTRRRYGISGILPDQAEPPGPFRAERVVFDGLAPDTEYEIQLPDGSVLPARTRPLARSPDRLSFLALSCNNPYTANGDDFLGEIEPDKLNSLKLLKARSKGDLAIEGWSRPAFALGLGDQVYVDGDNGHGGLLTLFQGDRSDPVFAPSQSAAMLETIYRAHFAMPPFSEALRHVPAAFIWDDHEVQDGFGTEENGKEGLSDYYAHARDAFLSYQWLRGPDGTRPRPDGTMDTRFSWGDQIQVMLLDTRTSGAAGISWQIQLDRVKEWLKVRHNKDEATLFVLGLSGPLTVGSHQSWFRKHIAAPVAQLFAGEQRDDLGDLWMSKAEARRELLTVLQDHFMERSHRKHRLLILSGDVHFSGINYLSTGAGSRFHRERGGKVGDDYRPQRVACPRNKDIRYLEDHVLWGWEVTSSGLSNAAIPGDLLIWGMKQGTINKLNGDSLVTTWPRGAIYDSPSFAELFVERLGHEMNVSAVFYPSRFLSQPVNLADRLNGAWELGAYDAVEGSRKMADCDSACRDVDKITAIPLDWDCIPDTNTGGTVYSCVHACSVVRGRGKPPTKMSEEDE